MLYLDYAKPLADGKYILSFFADSVADLERISHGQKFVTKNGTDYGVPQAGSTVIVTSPNSGKTTYVMDAEGIWVVTEDISYSAVVANPSDAATAKLEKLKVNDTTYANWTENEIKSIASESGGGKLYIHRVSLKSDGPFKDYQYYITVPSSDATPITKETAANRLLYGFVEEIDSQGSYHSSTIKNVTVSDNFINIDGTMPPLAIAATGIESDTVSER